MLHWITIVTYLSFNRFLYKNIYFVSKLCKIIKTINTLEYIDANFLDQSQLWIDAVEIVPVFYINIKVSNQGNIDFTNVNNCILNYSPARPGIVTATMPSKLRIKLLIIYKLYTDNIFDDLK